MSPTVPNLGDDLDLDALLRGRDALLRSGSAPPTLHGARSSLRLHGLLPEDAAAAQSHPDYPAYYYNHNLNPRLPPPTRSREDCRAAPAQRGGARAAGGGSLFVVQPGDMRAPERSQEDFRQPTYISGYHSRPVSRNALDNIVDTSRMSDPQLTQLHKDAKALENMHYGATPHGLTQVRSVGSTTSHSFASDMDTFVVRSATSDSQLIRRSPSPSLHGMGGRISDTDEKNLSNGFGGLSSGMVDCDDMSFHLSGLKLSDRITEDSHNHPDFLLNMASDQRQYTQSYMINDPGLSTSNGQTNLPRQLPPSDIYKKLAVGSVARSSGNYQTYSTDNDFVGCNSNGYSANQGLLSMPSNWPDAGATLPVGAESHYLNRSRNHVRSSFQVPGNDSSYVQYLQRAAEFGAQPSASPGASFGRNYRDGPFMDLPGYQEAYFGALLAQQKLLNDSSYIGKTGGFDNGLSDNPAFGRDVPYQNQISGSISSLGTGSSLRPTDRMPRFPSILRGPSGGSKGSWNHDIGITEESIASSLLEELKNNKTRSFELSEIVGHVVEFSGDQYGSRFIQQKLETASDEEKNNIFPEILTNARVLMTDVFGNYVIQKFFEYGTENQRNQLADALMGYVLPLSLQMYGCRVIQKALEVVDVDRQTKMVSELDGAVTKCVRDQNGNHVIQKCIECVPQEKIQFIVSSFYGQVVPLSTHPYGCRVIQRVLEHCDDVQTQSIMMEEILQSVCTLAQDQYGNYVIQHVLQHGKQEERACIIKKLAGQIVKMSQQKFASNVVEKCLAYSTPEQRELLIEEMLGTTDENEPLQAMMKDQFGNYVVQKVLESCDDQKLELIISRIKVHLSTLKKYTYGKHIVARVEKLIATGERRIGMSANAA